MLKKNAATICFISWMALVTFSSLFSFPKEDFEMGFEIFPHMDKIVHFSFYCGAAFLGCFALVERFKDILSRKKVFFISFLFSVIYGIIIEVLQMTFTESRHGDILDVLANTCGAVVGVLLVKFVFSGKMRLKWKN